MDRQVLRRMKNELHYQYAILGLRPPETDALFRKLRTVEDYKEAIKQVRQRIAQKRAREAQVLRRRG